MQLESSSKCMFSIIIVSIRVFFIGLLIVNVESAISAKIIWQGMC